MSTLPSGFRLALDSSVRRYADGRILVGGAPARLIRLTNAGRVALAELIATGATSPSARGLGRRLVDAGLAHPRPPQASAPPDVTIVVPVRDRTSELRRCLTAIGPGAPIVVVDDGSHDPGAVAAVCAAHDARVVRRDLCGGPAAARNTGAAAAGTELVAFLDSDCIVDPSWIDRLAAHFADPLVGAVAPRIRPHLATLSGWRALYGAARCPLDLGPDESGVGPGRRVAYVPTAALVIRRSALEPFDVGLRYGEDVDLVWRLHDAGWRVRYDPSVTVAHAEPDRWRSMLARRWRYGASAAPLARRHPGRLASLVARPAPLAAALLLLSRRPWLGAAVAGVQATAQWRRLTSTGIPAPRAAAYAAQAAGHTVVAVSRAGTMYAAPALVLALATRRTRPAAMALLLAGPLDEWRRRRPALDPVRWTLACLADDFAYGSGVWRGCLHERTIAPLLPRATPPS